MTPELKKLLENFNLDNYADCENLTLADWCTQFKFRELIGGFWLQFSEVIPELLKCPLRPEGFFTKVNPIAQMREPVIEQLSISDMRELVEVFIEDPSSDHFSGTRQYYSIDLLADDKLILEKLKFSFVPYFPPKRVPFLIL